MKYKKFIIICILVVFLANVFAPLSFAAEANANPETEKATWTSALLYSPIQYMLGLFTELFEL